MDFAFDAADDTFRQQARSWLEAHLAQPCATEGGRAWERELGRAGWIGLGWDTGTAGYGNRHATLTQQVAWAEEYARTTAPGRVGHIGENLLAPTLIAYGTDSQKQRFLPAVARGEELWCQGYSEPGAGSDLAAVRTRAVREDDAWVVTGQKIWTSLAHEAQWCFVLARTEPGSRRHAGLSYLLVPLDRPGVEIRPIVQLTGTSEFNEVFFDGARTDAANVVGAPGDGWRIAMATLGYERGVSTLGQQVGFRRELDALVALARRNGAAADPDIRDRLTRAWAGLEALRAGALRGTDPSAAKLYWSHWHRDLGELALEVCGPAATLAAAAPYELDDWQRLFLFSRADTVYAGSSEIQRNIIAERVLGLPKEPRP